MRSWLMRNRWENETLTDIFNFFRPIRAWQVFLQLDDITTSLSSQMKRDKNFRPKSDNNVLVGITEQYIQVRVKCCFKTMFLDWLNSNHCVQDKVNLIFWQPPYSKRDLFKCVFLKKTDKLKYFGIWFWKKGPEIVNLNEKKFKKSSTHEFQHQIFLPQNSQISC